MNTRRQMTTKKRTADAPLTEADLDLDAQGRFVKRTRSMSEQELLEYVAGTMDQVARSRPQRRRSA